MQQLKLLHVQIPKNRIFVYRFTLSQSLSAAPLQPLDEELLEDQKLHKPNYELLQPGELSNKKFIGAAMRAISNATSHPMHFALGTLNF
jgi:hypothetical protein